jgi:hypothetical protein
MSQTPDNLINLESLLWQRRRAAFRARISRAIKPAIDSALFKLFGEDIPVSSTVREATRIEEERYERGGESVVMVICHADYPSSPIFLVVEPRVILHDRNFEILDVVIRDGDSGQVLAHEAVG